MGEKKNNPRNIQQTFQWFTKTHYNQLLKSQEESTPWMQVIRDRGIHYPVEKKRSFLCLRAPWLVFMRLLKKPRPMAVSSNWTWCFQFKRRIRFQLGCEWIFTMMAQDLKENRVCLSELSRQDYQEVKAQPLPWLCLQQVFPRRQNLCAWDSRNLNTSPGA